MFLVAEIPFKELGPVQFSIGRSLNKVKELLIRNVRIVPTKKDAESGTFGEKAILKYSLILFHGFLNQIAAKRTILTENDVDKMLLALWHGTNNLSTSTKYGQISRVLLRIIYANENGYIGDLDRTINLENDPEEVIEDIYNAQINMTKLFSKLEQKKPIIKEINYLCHDDLSVIINNEKKNLKDYIEQWTKDNKINYINILDKKI